jgi:hypothetical protein
MADSIDKFFDRATRPPRGGWHFPIGGNNLIEKYSEQDVFESVKKWRKNNGTFVSDLDIERELWAYWCSRQPERCSTAPATSGSRQLVPGGALVPVEVTKEMQGPPMWEFLNVVAVQWTPALQDYFLHTCDAFVSLLVCPICRDEWREVLRKDPPAKITTRFEACQWTNRVHNEVNTRTGKQPFPYSRMVTEFGAPIS